MSEKQSIEELRTALQTLMDESKPRRNRVLAMAMIDDRLDELASLRHQVEELRAESERLKGEVEYERGVANALSQTTDNFGEQLSATQAENERLTFLRDKLINGVDDIEQKVKIMEEEHKEAIVSLNAAQARSAVIQEQEKTITHLRQVNIEYAEKIRTMQERRDDEGWPEAFAKDYEYLRDTIIEELDPECECDGDEAEVEILCNLVKREKSRLGAVLAQLSATQAKLQQAEGEAAAMAEALSPFSRFYYWIKAAFENGEIDTPTMDSKIAQLSVSGGSDYIWFEDLDRARKALSGYSSKSLLAVVEAAEAVVDEDFEDTRVLTDIIMVSREVYDRLLNAVQDNRGDTQEGRQDAD